MKKLKKKRSVSPERKIYLENLRKSIALPAAEKLRRLEALNHFLDKAMPAEAKKIAEELKRRGH